MTSWSYAVVDQTSLNNSYILILNSLNAISHRRHQRSVIAQRLRAHRNALVCFHLFLCMSVCGQRRMSEWVHAKSDAEFSELRTIFHLHQSVTSIYGACVSSKNCLSHSIPKWHIYSPAGILWPLVSALSALRLETALADSNVCTRRFDGNVCSESHIDCICLWKILTCTQTAASLRLLVSSFRHLGTGVYHVHQQLVLVN